MNSAKFWKMGQIFGSSRLITVSKRSARIRNLSTPRLAGPLFAPASPSPNLNVHTIDQGQGASANTAHGSGTGSPNEGVAGGRGGGGASTIIKDEIDKFERMSSNWWSQSGEFKALHSMNRLRIPFIRDGFLNNGQIEDSNIEFPLKGLQILDVGCGGGILSLPLGRLGATVTGLDAGKENIVMANAELESVSADSGLQDRVRFVHTSLEEFVADHLDEFDGVVVSEVLEHVADPKYFLQLAADVVKPGGSLFITTINRTQASWLGAIVAGEYLLRLLPIGTHSWSKFVAPEEVQTVLNKNGMTTRLIHGMAYNVWTDSWSWTRCVDINYALQAVKLN